MELFSYIYYVKNENYENKFRNGMMVTKFTKGVDYFNKLLDQTKKGSKSYKLLCLAKYRYIQDY